MFWRIALTAAATASRRSLLLRDFRTMLGMTMFSRIGVSAERRSRQSGDFGTTVAEGLAGRAPVGAVKA